MARLTSAQIRHTCWRHPIWPKRWDTLRPTMALISAKQRGSLVSPTSIVVAPCWWHWHCLTWCRNNHLRCPWLLRQPLLVFTATHRHCLAIIIQCSGSFLMSPNFSRNLSRYISFFFAGAAQCVTSYSFERATYDIYYSVWNWTYTIGHIIIEARTCGAWPASFKW